MTQSFVTDFDINNLTKPFFENENRFLLENNKKQLESLFNFYSDIPRLMIVNGFIGSGKSQVIEHSKHFLGEDVVILEYNCFETTILDDILLLFYTELHELVVKGQIKQLKTKTDNFMQKIVSYFNELNKPVLIILNSFENILNPNKKEIFDFLFHILKKDTVKLIIATRKFNFEEYIPEIPYQKTTVLAFEKSLFEKYLRSEGIKNIGPVSDELYKFTKGYFLYTKLSIIIMKARKLSLIDFIDGYTKSFLSFADFIFREALSFVDPVSGHLVRLLTLLRHPIGIKLLQDMGLYDKERVDFFVQNLILSKEQDSLYLQDYYKEISSNSISENVSVKLHKACAELYSSQLPLKPFERDILISRQTMRGEIVYHNSFIPKKPKLVKEIAATETTVTPEQAEQPPQPNPQTKEEILKNISFIFHTEEEEQKIMDEIADSINGFIDYSNKVLAPDESQLPFMDLINKANYEETRFNYQKAIAFYQSALTMKEDIHYPQMVSRIYTKTAECFEHLSDWYNSAKYYETAMAYFLNSHDYEKYNEIKLALANVFFITYKHDKARILLNEIINEKENISNNLKIQALINLADLSNPEDKPELYIQASELSDISTNNDILSKLYYKTGALYDELEMSEKAITCYKKCAKIQPDNKYRASALSGIAQILEDTGMLEKAIVYYKESLAIEEKEDNLNGIYFISEKLANIFKHKNSSEAKKYFLLAINTADKINIPYCIMMANIKCGDFCYLTKQFLQAAKCYQIALKTAQQDKKCEKYTQKITQRIDKLTNNTP